MSENVSETIIAYPVKAERRPFGDWVWFIVDADNHAIAQTMPSTDERTCREMADAINQGRALAGIADPERTIREAREALALLIKRQTWFLSIAEGQLYSGHQKSAMDELAMGVEALALLSPKP